MPKEYFSTVAFIYAPSLGARFSQITIIQVSFSSLSNGLLSCPAVCCLRRVKQFLAISRLFRMATEAITEPFIRARIVRVFTVLTVEI